ncbi:uncharacterized protein PSFLO_05598 [Pseudozyma flocculosa]|uniref:Uncharacterized protein n=1 Tax=Pseudozyma flocculosa TaxID=84751 RepID=A0A5C3F7T8_9BASI|nr:uncharacterized protein PSFLO_05598 [Pseudozyma flocculosa]
MVMSRSRSRSRLRVEGQGLRGRVSEASRQARQPALYTTGSASTSRASYRRAEEYGDAEVDDDDGENNDDRGAPLVNLHFESRADEEGAPPLASDRRHRP